MDAQGIVNHIGAEKLRRLDADNPDEFESTISAYIDLDQDYDAVRTEILELIGAENPPLTGDDLRMFIQGVKEESKQNTGGTKVRITESRLRQIIKEEISNIVNEGKTLNVDGVEKKLPIVWLVQSPKGLGGVAKSGSNVILGQGFPGTPDDQYQLFVLPEPIGSYKTLQDARNASFTGERYYASAEEILASGREETVQPGEFAGNTVTVKV